MFNEIGGGICAVLKKILHQAVFMSIAHATEDENAGTTSQLVTPECFNRGSSPKFAWIPAKNMRE
jgi:hypothetical protein